MQKDRSKPGTNLETFEEAAGDKFEEAFGRNPKFFFVSFCFSALFCFSSLAFSYHPGSAFQICWVTALRTPSF